MIGRLLLAGMLSAFCLTAQLRLFSVQADTERPVDALFEFGTVPAGDLQDVTFRIRNSGSSPAVVSTVSLAGTGFTR